MNTQHIERLAANVEVNALIYSKKAPKAALLDLFNVYIRTKDSGRVIKAMKAIVFTCLEKDAKLLAETLIK